MALPFLGRRRVSSNPKVSCSSSSSSSDCIDSSGIKKQFTDLELQELRTAFRLLDRNHDGRVTTSEFKIMLNNLGIDIRDDKVEQLIRNASHSGKEIIDENDFLNWVKQIQQLCPPDEDDLTKDLMAAFKVFDLNNDGYITKDELRIAMEMIGETVTEAQLSQFIVLADVDKDGKINYEEFAKMLS